MENLSSKVSIGMLEGKENWTTWKFKILILIRSVDRAIDVIEGKFTRPIYQITSDGGSKGDEGAAAARSAKYKADLAAFVKAETSALLIITTNMSDVTLEKVMRFNSSREIWLELHRLFDDTCEDRSYNLCMRFFGFNREPKDDIATHLSKLKNIWSEMNREMSKSDDKKELPELLLICKILDILGQEYFSFRNSWLLIAKQDRTVENLTSHLCAFERALSTVPEQGILSATTSTKRQFKKDKKIKCNYCLENGHRVRNCSKWIRDGKPPKSTNPTPSTSNLKHEHANKSSFSASATAVDNVKADRDRDNWWIDNGATSHITNRSDLFQNFERFDDLSTVTTANGNTVRAIGKGSVILNSKVNGKMVSVTLKDVWYVPSIQRNLVSVLAAHDRNPASIFTSNGRQCRLSVDGETKLVGHRCLNGGLYKLDVKNEEPKQRLEVFMTTETQMYHERIGHQNKRHVRALIKRELGIDLPTDHDLCEGCINGKAHRLEFGTRARASTPGELIHADVCGPFPYSFSKYRYFLLFKDDYTKFRFIYLLREKSEVPEKLKLLIAQVKNTGYTVKELLSDNGGEFDNHRVRDILQTEGIKHRLICPYTPEQNGCAERENRTVVETARAMMHAHQQLPEELWGELVNTAVYILNRTGPTPILGKTPYELWFGKKATIKHLRIIGSTCYVHVPKQKRKKLNKKACKGILVGYTDDGYRIWRKVSKKDILIVSRDVIFDEKSVASIEGDTEVETQKGNVNEYIVRFDRPSIEPTRTDELRQIIETQPIEAEGDRRDNSQDVVANIEPVELEGEDCVEDNVDLESNVEEFVNMRQEVANDLLDSFEQPVEEFVDAEERIEPELRYKLRDRSKLQQPTKFDDYVMAVLNDEMPEPLTYKQAMLSRDRDKWLTAMESELSSLHENKTWTLQELPRNRKAIPCKWVFKVKRNPDGSIERYKARLVVKGFRQKKGTDYEETFSPVARMATIRALISVAACERMHLVQFDVTTAFLHGHLKEEIYMKQPEGFEDDTNRVCRLKRSLYGLKQAPRCWNHRFHEILKEIDFEQSTADPCLYTKKYGDKKILLTLFVDDGLVAATDEKLANEFFSNLRERLKITTKPANYYQGMEIMQCKGSIVLKQEAYTRKLLERFGMSDCNPVSTPIDKEAFESGKVTSIDDEDKSFPYREAVGALAYLMVSTRPDIAYAVGVSSRKLEAPTKSDWLNVKRIMRYLKGTLTCGLKYKLGHLPGILEGFSDADHGGDTMTGRSTTGVVSRYAGGAIAWLSQRQASVAISTTEAELVAASEAARELVWLKRMLEELTTLSCTPTLSVDNEAAVRLAHNPEFHKRTKHIRIRHFYVRELVAKQEIRVQRIASSDQVADIMTKGLPRPSFNPLRGALGLN